MRTLIRFLAAMALLAGAIPAQPARADSGDTSKQTTKKKVADQSRKVDKFIDENKDGVNDLLQQKVVRPSAAETSTNSLIQRRDEQAKAKPAPSAQDESSKPAAAPEKPKDPPKPKTDKSKVEKQPAKKPD